MPGEFICEICGNTKFNVPYTNDFKVIECSKCKYGTIDPVPSGDTLDKLYNSKQYFNSHMHTKYEELNETELKESIQKQGAFHFHHLMKVLKQNSTILEIGPGYGLQLKYLANAGYTVKGVETSANAAAFIKNKLELPVECSGFEEYNDKNSYDVLMLNHVLEHFTDLHLVMKKIKDLLKNGGHLYIRVPNHDSYDRRKMGIKWPAYLPFHISYFSKKSLKLLLAKYDFEIISIEEYISDEFLKKFPKYLKYTAKLLMFILGISPFLNGRTITIIAKNHV